MDIEKELIDACIKESRKAQFELYKKCYSLLMSICMRYEKNKEDAEALLNQAFFKILTNLKKRPENAPFEAWIRRITINTVIDEYRKKKRSQLDYLEEPMLVAPISEMSYNEADQKLDAEDLENIIKQLPPVSQTVFNLYVIDGYNHKEIGEKLNISEGTSKWHLSSARKKLKTLMRKILSNVAVLV